MRIGTTATVLGVAVALAGCGGGATTHRQAQDSIATSDAATTADSVTVPVTFGGPGSNPHVITDAPPVQAENENKGVEGDDQIVQPPVAPPSCPGGPTVHFDTPEAAMTYLAAAWNRNDLAALCQVTNPNARFLLNDMHSEAVNLRLKRCDPAGVGAYQCTFMHDYPAHMHRAGHGQAWLDVEAADNPGWYMAGYMGCG